ncbi:MAG TPA: sporulation protein [Micromonospora sp.]
MVFKKVMRMFGVGGPSVDTVLVNPNTRPGLTLDGHINIVGGDHDVHIEHVALSLATRVEVESGDSEYQVPEDFHRVVVSGPFALAAGQHWQIPFSFPVPWETPITDIYGQRLHGMTMGLRTEVAVAKAVDKGDLDPIFVHPLPAQERILDAFARLGFRFARADLERGYIHGVHQTLPFYQEIEFYPPPQYANGINEVEVTFVTDPHGVEVILEFDKRGGFFTPGQDVYGRFRVEHAAVDQTDWTAVVDSWVRQASERYFSWRASHGYAPPPAHGGYAPPHGGYAPPMHGGYAPPPPPVHGGHAPSHGSAVGAALAGAAGGLIGGMMLGAAMDELFDGDGDDDGGDADFGE